MADLEIPAYVQIEPAFVFGEEKVTVRWVSEDVDISQTIEVGRQTVWIRVAVPPSLSRLTLEIECVGWASAYTISTRGSASYVESLNFATSRDARTDQQRDYVTSLPVKDMLSLAGRVCSSNQSKIVYVTGTAGKTSTKEIIGNCLAGFRTIISTDSWNPAHEACAQLIVNSDWATHYVFEMAVSELLPLVGMQIPPSVFVFTHLGPGHSSVRSTVAENGRLKFSLAARMTNGTIVFNRDSAELCQIVGEHLEDLKARGNEVWAISEDGSFRCLCNPIRLNVADVSHVFSLISRDIDDLLVPKTNALCAILACLAAGAAPAAIARGMRQAAAPHRLEVVQAPTAVLLKDAYNANPLSMSLFLNKVESQYRSKHRKLLILGDMIDLGEETELFHRIILDRFRQADHDVYFVGSTFFALRAEGTRARFFNSSAELETALGEEGALRQWDFIGIKGSAATGLRAVSDNIELALLALEGET